MVGGWHRARRSLEADEAGVFIVVEAVLVAVIILTAVLFYTSVQRPQRTGQQGSTNLGQVATDSLAILKGHTFADPAAPSVQLDMRGWVTRVMAGDTAVAADVDEFMTHIVPAGARYTIRVNNGLSSLPILPLTDPGLAAGAQAAEAPLFPLWGSYAKLTRTFVDGVTTAGSTTLTSATAAFTVTDVGRAVSGPGIPGGTVVATLTSASSVELSNAATQTSPATGIPVRIALPATLTVSTTASSTTVTAAPAANVFAASEVGKPVYGSGIPAGATIASVTSPSVAVLSAAATATSASTVLVVDGLPRAVTLATTSGLTTVTAASATFVSADVGRPLRGAGIPLQATIASVTDATHAVLSEAATSTGAAVAGLVDVATAPPGQEVSSGALYTLTQNGSVKCIRGPVASATTPTKGAQLAPRTLVLPDAVTTSGSATVTASSASFVASDVGRPVSGAGIPTGAKVTAVGSSTSITLSTTATASATGVTLTLGTTWASFWQAGQSASAARVPPQTPFGVWAGYTDSACTEPPAVYARVGLAAGASPDDYPIYGIQLVVWYGA